MEYIRNISESQRRLIIKILFLAFLVVFALPFVTVSCQGSTVAELSGYNLAFGKEINDQMMGNSQKTEPAMPAVIALIVAVAGAIIAFVVKNDTKFNMSTAALGLIGLISMLLLKSGIKEKVQQQSLQVDFNAGFSIALIMFLVVTALGGGFYYIFKNDQKSQVVITTSDNSESVGGE